MFSRSKLISVHPLHPVAYMLQGNPCFQGHCYLEVMSSRSKLIRGHVFKVRVYWLSSFKVRIDWWSCLQVQDSQIACKGCPHAGRLGCRNWLCWLGPYSPESGPGVHPLHPVACMLQGRPCFQGQCNLEVMSSRSSLFGGH